MARLNVQGLARGHKGLMSSLIPEPGHTFVSVDLCYPSTYEVLTKRGFIKFTELLDTDQIWQVDYQSLMGSWTLPTRRILYKYTGNMVTYSNRYGDFTVTQNHRMLWVGQYNHPTRQDKKLRRRISCAGDFSENCADHFAHFSLSQESPDNSITDQEIWKACMLHADSYYDKKTGRYNLQLAKPRKRDKARDLLGQNGRTYPIRPGHNLPVEHWSGLQFTSPLLTEKTFNLSSLESLTARQVDVFVKALQFWDGTYVDTSGHSKRSGRFSWGQVNLSEVEKIQAFLIRRGYGADLADKNNFYTLSIKKYKVTRLNLTSNIIEGRKTKTTQIIINPVQDLLVGCVTVPEGYILIRTEGKVFLGSNCAGEPVCTSHYSQDKNYMAANFGMVGKDPYYDGKTLMIDDIYLMVMSRSPIGSDRLREAWEAKYDGLTFVEQWAKDKEYIQKKVLRQPRQLHKILALGLSYAMGPKKLVKQARDNGFTLSPKAAKAFYDCYWELFSGVYRFGKVLEKEFEETGYLVNDFGYRLKPAESYKCLNYFIQSSVSGIISVLYSKFFSICDFALFVTIIHDEIIISVPEDRQNEAKALMDQAVASLNEDLGWTVRVRTGWAVGKNLYEAK